MYVMIIGKEQEEINKLKSIYMYRLHVLTKREVKRAGYWPSSLFCIFMDWDKVDIHKLTKKNKANVLPS